VLKSVLEQASSVVSGKVVYNIESNVFMELKGTELVIRSTNNTLWYKNKVTVSDCVDGSICLYADTFSKIISTLPDGVLTFDSNENNKAIITCGKTKHIIIGMASDEFPSFPDISDVTAYEVYEDDVVEMSKVLCKFTSKEVFRPTLRGIHLSAKDGKLRTSATDGKRLCDKVYYDFDDADFDIIVEPLFMHMLASQKEPVSIGVKDGFVVGFCGDMVLICLAIEGKFPSVDQVIPKSFDKYISTDSKEFIRALRSVIPMIKDMRSHKIILSAENGELEVLAVNMEMGESKNTITCEGDNGRLAFNYEYLIQVLDSMEDDMAVIRYNDDTTPVVITSVVSDVTYVIMPMKVDEEV